jgi:signal transduction histidine kinase
MKYLKSYQSKILLSFFGLTLVLACAVFFYHRISVRNRKLDVVASNVNELETSYLSKTRHLQNFLLYGYHQSAFYTQGTQPDIDSFQTYLKKNMVDIGRIKRQIEKNGMHVYAAIETLPAENQKLLDFITDLKEIYRKKGYKDFGMEGRMRSYAHLLEDSSLIPEISILLLRRYEKDFLLRGELQYADNFLKLIDSFIIKYQTRPATLAALTSYKASFATLVDYNKKIGIYTSDGLYNVIQEQLSSLDRQYLQLNTATNAEVAGSKIKNKLFLYIGGTVFFILIIITIWLLSKYLSREIRRLNGIMVNFINSGFNTTEAGDQFNPRILEVDTLHRSFLLLKQKLKNMLEEKSRHQKILVSAVIEGQEKERKNIGAELHDNINPLLATAKMYLCVARDNEPERLAMIQTSKEVIDETVSEIRKLSHVLVGPPASEFLLQQSLKELVTAIEVGASFKINFTSNDFDESQLSENIKLTIYRIVQEQMNNVVKYAAAENVHISICENRDELVLMIKDNGIGFDTNKKTKGIGLRNIETRLELVNGKMFISTSPGKGCEMQVSVPV